MQANLRIMGTLNRFSAHCMAILITQNTYGITSDLNQWNHPGAQEK